MKPILTERSDVKMPKTQKDNYLSAFTKGTDRKAPAWINQTRKSAINRFRELGFPTTREENWKYTNVGPIAETPFKFVSEFSPHGISIGQIKPFLFSENWPRLVFVNGVYSKELSSNPVSENGLKVVNLEPILNSDSKLIEPYFARYARYEQNGFTALNTAFFQDGAFIYLPEGKTVKKPIHLLFISSDQEDKVASYPRVLIVAGKNSKAAIIESYVSIGNVASFTNAVTELVIGEGASVDHYKIQNENQNAFHIGTTQVHQEQDSKFLSSSISTGARIARNNLSVGLEGEGAECHLRGLYFASGEQHVDNTTLIDHPKPHGTSRQLYKGIVGGKATAVFSGKIFVHKNAVRTDAEQTNKNLLLSEKATADTKPQLEILNDDVKCTHGAAVGQLDEEAVFYLKTRGIGEERARKLLSYGFANEVVEQMGVEGVRSELSRQLVGQLERLSNGKH